MSTDPRVLQNFLKEYETWALDVLAPARLAVRSVLDQWRKPEYWREKHSQEDHRQPIPTPIHRTTSRIKRPESAADKILRKPESYPDGLTLKSIKRLPDALGARIITYFLSGLPIIHNEIVNSPQFELCEEPIAYLDEEPLRTLGLSHLRSSKKDSGYSSIHYAVRLRPQALGGNESPLMEIQLRTVTLDTWGEIEHVLGYKPNKRTSFAVQAQFGVIASLLASIDQLFNMLYEEQTRLRHEKIIEDPDPLNAENLPAMLNRYGLVCAQHEVDGMLKLLASRGIRIVKELDESASRKKIELIRNTYRSHEGRDPIDFEIVANIAATSGMNDLQDIQKVVEAQIDFLKTWENLKKHSRGNPV